MMSSKRTKPEAYREMYAVLADEIGSYAALCLIADTKPNKEDMISLGALFTKRTGQVHDLDPMHTEKLGYAAQGCGKTTS
jgi:hypothetical protein